MHPDRCLQVCLVGDPGIGVSSFLRAYRDSEGGSQPDAQVESVIACVELDNEPFCVRFTDNVASPYFESLRNTALGTAHVVLICFAMDDPQSLEHVKEQWYPLFWSVCSEAPTFLVGLRSDSCAEAGGQSIDECEAAEVAHRLGALAFMDCSAQYPETVRKVVDEVLPAAKEHYSLQWQLQPQEERLEPEPARHPVTEAREEVDGAAWVAHERLNINEDTRSLDEATASKSLSVLGVTPSKQHAYLRLDIPDLGLTSLDAVRRYKHLQFVNVSKNQLRSLEPLGALRCLLHLNASYNLLIRTQSFAAPECLETVDMSYNMIGSLGEWGVHKYLRELNLRGNFITKIGPGLRRNAELRMLDLSENHIPHIENLDHLGLRTLFLAQNRLTSLEGVSTLSKLQVLNVRHNNITSVAALRAEDVPRLRKLFISENRISHIKEIEGLQSFKFLCDLVLVPNPIMKLPHYRAQVTHRLPHLRALDLQPVPAEEKVKADLIYGSDVEERRGVFEELLPEEGFVDRRLVTEDGIAKLEQEQFGQQGDAGPYGFTVSERQEAAQNLARTALQDASFRQRLEQARRGGMPVGVCDLTSFAAPFSLANVCDEDLPEVLEAVSEGRVTHLLLGAAPLSVNGVREVVAFLAEAPHLRHVDLTGCQAVCHIGAEIANAFPYARGCSMETENCGISKTNVVRLRNQTPEAMEALGKLEDERARTDEMMAKFMAQQEVLEEFAAENCSQAAAPPPPVYLCHPAKWQEAIAVRSQVAYKAFRKDNPNGCASGISADGNRSWSVRCRDGSLRTLFVDDHTVLGRMRNSMLEEWGCEISYEREDNVDCEESRPGESVLSGRPLPQAFTNAFGNVLDNDSYIGFMVWDGMEPSREILAQVRREREEWEALWSLQQQRCQALSVASRKLYDAPMRETGLESGQLMAHFSYLCLGGELSGNDPLRKPKNFGLKRFSEAKPPRPRHGKDLQEVVASGEVAIEGVTGNYATLRLKLHNNDTDDLDVAVRCGTIFQHHDWAHRQNLMVCVDYVIRVPGNETVTKELKAYCMNLTCACSRNSSMALTDFYLDDAEILASQGRVWDHFQGCFGQT